jgi:hypothetical protein
MQNENFYQKMPDAKIIPKLLFDEAYAIFNLTFYCTKNAELGNLKKVGFSARIMVNIMSSILFKKYYF